jgi:hypothetical protein
MDKKQLEKLKKELIKSIKNLKIKELEECDQIILWEDNFYSCKILQK